VPSIPLRDAYHWGAALADRFHHAGHDAAVVGDARRGRRRVRELELLVRGASPAQVADIVRPLLADDRATVPRRRVLRLTLAGRCDVVVRAVDAADWPEALVTFTGPDTHVAWLKKRARAHAASWRKVAREAEDEGGLYEALRVPFVPPELRSGRPPARVGELVSTADVAGFLHCHTEWSDGSASVVAMARATERAGFTFLGISDHSPSDTNGLDAERLRRQASAIADARVAVPRVRILHGVEVDILEDGSLDLPDDALRRLDFVIASVHRGLRASQSDMTRRIVAALRNPLVTILGHPTGRRLIDGRDIPGADFDLGTVCNAAVANGTAIEINASPFRQDPAMAVLRAMAAKGVTFAINPDAHLPCRVGDTYLGVMLARWAGLAPNRILNAGTAGDVLRRLRERKVRAMARDTRAESAPAPRSRGRAARRRPEPHRVRRPRR